MCLSHWKYLLYVVNLRLLTATISIDVYKNNYTMSIDGDVMHVIIKSVAYSISYLLNWKLTENVTLVMFILHKNNYVTNSINITTMNNPFQIHGYIW